MLNPKMGVFMRQVILTVFSVISLVNLFAQGVVSIDDSNTDGVFDLSGDVFYLIDTESQYSFEQVLSSEFEEKFIQAKDADFAYKNKVPTQWYKLKIDNNTSQTKELVLSIDNPLIEDITFFSSFDSAFYHAGLVYPFKQRQVIFNNYLFRIKVLPGQKGVVCFNVKKQGIPEYLPISLMSEKTAFDKLRINAFVEGLFYCIFLIFLLVVLVLWQTEKKRSYLCLFAFILLLGFLSLWRDGYLFQFVWPNSPNLNYTMGRVIHSLLVFFLLLFINNFLKVKKTHKVLSNIVKISLVAALLFSISQFFLHQYGMFYYGYRVLLGLLLIISAWSVYGRRKDKIQYFNHYIFGISIIVVNLIVSTFILIPTYGIGFYDAQTATFATILFFLAIVHVFISKFKSSRLEVIGLNKNLEGLVVKRTAELNMQKEELKAQHEELIQQKEILQTQREELRAKKELLELNNAELAKLSLVASKTDNLIYICLPNGELDWFNTSFSNKIGLTLEEYHRSNSLSIIDVSTNKNIKHVLNTCLREKIVVSYETKLEEENQPGKWYHTTLTPILDDRENISYLIAIDTDITQLKHFETEINEQRNDAELQKNLAIKRKEELEERQIEITDSIRYAKRIQTGIMPKVKQIQRDFYDSFVLFLPKDIVSGDFYWYHRIKDKYFIAAVDCTGHGVPGAFMSIIGTYLLNSIIISNEVSDPAEILKQLNRKLKIALKADSRSETNDGMDLSIAIIDKNQNTIEFASALRPVYLFNSGDFIEIKGDKIPITSSISGITISSFTTHSYPFNEGDMFYLFSDGIIDQFGGKHGKKFLTKRFKQVLFEINPLSMKEQKEIVKKAFDDWRGESEQVDDILVMGIRNKHLPYK
jgi:serine phosphatase RsbU (regulator of sigma subunit)/PAS domain-containing protein